MSVAGYLGNKPGELRLKAGDLLTQRVHGPVLEGTLRGGCASCGGAPGLATGEGVREHGPILEGLVTPVDALLLYSPRGNPLDPFNLAEELLEGRL